MENNYYEFKKAFEELKETDYDSFLNALYDSLLEYTKALASLYQANNNERKIFRAEFVLLFLAYVKGLINIEEWQELRDTNKLLIQNAGLTKEMLIDMRKIILKIIDNESTDDLIDVVEGIELIYDILCNRKTVYNNFRIIWDARMSGFDVMLPGTNLSLEEENKKIEKKLERIKMLKKKRT